MTETAMTHQEAMQTALHDALVNDERVMVLRETSADDDGTGAADMDLAEAFGSARVRHVTTSESAFVGCGIGAAINGMRPIVEIRTINVALLALNQIVTVAAAWHHLSAGQMHVPIVIRLATDVARPLAAPQAHGLEGWFAQVPGLKVVAPASVRDARWMLAAAIADPDPVIVFEDPGLAAHVGDPGREPVSLNGAEIRRRGDDLTIVASAAMVDAALAAADLLANQGISVEVIDLRCLRPIDTDTLQRSVNSTHRALMISEGWRTEGLSSQIVADLSEACFDRLVAPISQLTETLGAPLVDEIVSAAMRIIHMGAAA